MSCFQIKIFGLVQGVFFRYSAKIEAEKLGLVGYAKNLPPEGRGDLSGGAVEIVVCSPAENFLQKKVGENKIQEFINWCHRGPALAKIERVEIKEIPLKKFDNFQIL